MTLAPPASGRPAALVLIVLGAALALGGAELSRRSLATGDLIAKGEHAWRGVAFPPPEDIAATIDRLQAIAGGRPTAEEAAALSFLHYIGASDAGQRRDTDAWRRELLAARAEARRTLALEPTQAEVALELAETEFLLGSPAPVVENALAISFDAAPNELWIATRRIVLGLRLVATAPPVLRADIAHDIRIIGEPYRDTQQYRGLAIAAFQAGPEAAAFVRQELAALHPEPLAIFESYLAELETVRAATAPSKPN